MKLNLHVLPTLILGQSSGIEWGKAPAREPVFTSLICGCHLYPHPSVWLQRPFARSICHVGAPSYGPS